MIDWKMLVFVLIGLGLISFGAIKQTGLDMNNFLNDLQEKTSDVTGKIISDVQESTIINRNVTVSGKFINPGVELDKKKLEFLIKYDPSVQDYDIFIGKNKLSTETSTTLYVSGFTGTLKAGDFLDIMGSADQVKINGVEFQKIKTDIPLEITLLKYQQLEVINLDKTLDFNQISGDVTIQNKVSVKLDNEPLNLESFLGKISLTPSKMNLNGKAKRVFISGRDYTATVSG